MASGSIRLRGRELLERYNISMYRLKENGAASWPTVYKYMAKSDEVENFSADVLYGILIDGIGLTPEQAADLKIGDIFEFVPDANGAA